MKEKKIKYGKGKTCGTWILWSVDVMSAAAYDNKSDDRKENDLKTMSLTDSYFPEQTAFDPVSVKRRVLFLLHLVYFYYIF